MIAPEKMMGKEDDNYSPFGYWYIFRGKLAVKLPGGTGMLNP